MPSNIKVFHDLSRRSDTTAPKVGLGSGTSAWELRVDLGPIGVWSGRLQRRPTTQALELVDEWGQLGYGAAWVPESPGGKNVLTFAAVLLGGTRRIPVATGIAIIWARDPVAMMNASRTLVDAFPGRFLLGIGVSHESTAVLRGHEYRKPLSAARAYLEAMDAAAFDGNPPDESPNTVVAALGPEMIALAGQLADGIHPFLTPPEHTRAAREILGADKIIAVEQGIILISDPDEARDVARANLSRYLQWPNYRNHFLRLGFGEHDLQNGGSDRLLDAIYAWGDEGAIRARISEHHAAGADHVCLQFVGGALDEPEALRELAPALLAN